MFRGDWRLVVRVIERNCQYVKDHQKGVDNVGDFEQMLTSLHKMVVNRRNDNTIPFVYNVIRVIQ